MVGLKSQLDKAWKETVATYSRYQPHLHGETEENHKNICIRINGILAEIRTEYLPSVYSDTATLTHSVKNAIFKNSTLS
jgi:hypothetical protein